jgi:hypothetical protein
MVAIKGLAVVAVAGVAVIALAPRVAAEPGRENFQIEVRYDTARSALDNYLAFARLIERTCEAHGVRGLDARRRERACVRETLDRLVSGMDRAELAEVHDSRIGRRADSSRTLAVR